MKMVDFVSTSISTSILKKNTLLSNKSNHYFTFSNIGIQIYDDIQKNILFSNNAILGMSFFLRK